VAHGLSRYEPKPPVKPIEMTPFLPGQILCLEAPKTYLYSETIQTIPDRQLCWARPLALVTAQGEQGEGFEPNLIYTDLRESSDLLLPIAWFRVALDTEVIPVLMALEATGQTDASADKPPLSPPDSGAVCQQLQAFIRQLCAEK
jgi:hypothetical protein